MFVLMRMISNSVDLHDLNAYHLCSHLSVESHTEKARALPVNGNKLQSQALSYLVINPDHMVNTSKP